MSLQFRVLNELSKTQAELTRDLDHTADERVIHLCRKLVRELVYLITEEEA